MFLFVLGWTAATLSVVRLLPQMVTPARGSGAAGVSASTLALAAASGALWVGWALTVANWPAMVSSALGTLPPVMTAVFLARRAEGGRPLEIVAASVSLGLVAGLVFPSIAGWVGVALATTLAVPQLHRTLRTTSAGVSGSAWLLVAANAVLWGVYGVAIGQWQLVVPGIVTLPAALVIAWRAAGFRTRGSVPAPAH